MGSTTTTTTKFTAWSNEMVLRNNEKYHVTCERKTIKFKSENSIAKTCLACNTKFRQYLTR